MKNPGQENERGSGHKNRMMKVKGGNARPIGEDDFNLGLHAIGVSKWQRQSDHTCPGKEEGPRMKEKLLRVGSPKWSMSIRGVIERR